MESQQNQSNQMPTSASAPAPKSQSTGKLWVGLSILLTLVSIGLLVALVLVLTGNAETSDQDNTGTSEEQTMNTEDQSDSMDDGSEESNENEADTQTAWETYNNRGITVEFPDAWNFFGEFIYDNPNSDTPEFRIFLNDTPLQVVSPSGGPSIGGDVEIRSLAPDAAYLAGYEEADWASYESDTVTIGGRTVQRLRLTAGEDMVYVAENMEVLFFLGEDISYEVVYNYSDGEMAPEWSRIKNSLRFTDDINAR